MPTVHTTPTQIAIATSGPMATILGSFIVNSFFVRDPGTLARQNVGIHHAVLQSDVTCATLAAIA
jgi:hypothetical protein